MAWVHGNSLLSARPQNLYNIITTEGAHIVKIGIAETSILAARYSAKDLKSLGVELVEVASYSNRLIAYAVEQASILGYAARTGSRPVMQTNFPRAFLP
jgi:hypothetical protein